MDVYVQLVAVCVVGGYICGVGGWKKAKKYIFNKGN